MLFSFVFRFFYVFFFSSRRRHTRLQGDWSSDVCSSDLAEPSARTKVLGRDDKKIKCNAALKRCTARTKLLRYRYGFFRQASLLAQGGGLVGLLPGEVRIVAAKVPVGRGLAIDRTP